MLLDTRYECIRCPGLRRWSSGNCWNIWYLRLKKWRRKIQKRNFRQRQNNGLVILGSRVPKSALLSSLASSRRSVIPRVEHWKPQKTIGERRKELHKEEFQSKGETRLGEQEQLSKCFTEMPDATQGHCLEHLLSLSLFWLVSMHRSGKSATPNTDVAELPCFDKSNQFNILAHELTFLKSCQRRLSRLWWDRSCKEEKI